MPEVRDWARVRELFDALCDLDADARERRIAAAGLDAAAQALLVSMLAADRAERIAADAQAQAPVLVQSLAADKRVGQRLGDWQVDALVGAGGMGRVYRAHRDDGRYQGVAAIKFVAEVADTASFERERLVLGRLQHPGIARLLDAGEDARGRPYLVMEFVDGRSIDAACEASGCDARARIALVRAATEAVAYAHGRMVLHRDLKPGNMLVDARGQVKLLDFGVAKLLDTPEAQPERTTARFFTLRYAAPEQIAGEAVGVGADIYALAVILFELLSGAHPFQGDGLDARSLAERVLSGGPRSLREAAAGEARRRLAGFSNDRKRDLDAVLAKALAREPSARYASAQEFADELGRVLDDRPVLAHADAFTTQVRRFVRRHRAAVAIALIALGALVATTIFALQQAERARRERDLAQHEAARAERVAAFLTSLFEAVRPLSNQGVEPRARELLDQGRDRLAELTDEPALRLALQGTIADSYRAIGHYQESEQLLVDALAHPLLDRRTRLNLALQLGRLHNFQGRWEDAAQRLLEAQALLDIDAPPRTAAAIARHLAVTRINQNRLDEAAMLAQSALLQQGTDATTPLAERIESESLVATIAFARGEAPQAVEAYARIVALQRGAGESAEASLVTSLNNLAAIEMRLDRVDAALAHYREAVQLAERRFGARNREVALPLLGLGMALRAAGEAEQSLDALARAQALYQEWSGAAHPETAYAFLLHAETTWLVDPAATIDLAALRAAESALAQSVGADGQKRCRAGTLLALVTMAAGEAHERAIACLSAAQLPPNQRLLAEYARARMAHAAGASFDRAALRRHARDLVPRDVLLQSSLRRWLDDLDG